MCVHVHMGVCIMCVDWQGKWDVGVDGCVPVHSSVGAWMCVCVCVCVCARVYMSKVIKNV
jgi:hypothetical protein